MVVVAVASRFAEVKVLIPANFFQINEEFVCESSSHTFYVKLCKTKVEPDPP